MNIIIFLCILAILVLVHEFGHFIVAKKSGVRVDEFGLGFPPRIFGKKFGETVYSLNLLPFGGFVKIFGENAESLETPEGVVENSSRSLMHKNRAIQAAVMVAGVTMNVFFAWLIISLGLVFGLPSAVESGNAHNISNARVVITNVLPDSPAKKAGLAAGDAIIEIGTAESKIDANLTPENISAVITKSTEPLTIVYTRGDKTSETTLTPVEGIISGKPAVGISMDIVGILKLPIHEALWEGGVRTIQLFKIVSVNIFYFLSDAILGRANLSEVAGPIGMVALVGDARELGFAYLIFFTALLSINLAVINLIPFPALDGGRLVMIAIEAVKRSPLNPKFIQGINLAGFALLIILMLVVTGSDIIKLF
ncbi:MAG: site-2 protease family protein [bacterium]|nr:site-2 protease family protein [bacterium]